MAIPPALAAPPEPLPDAITAAPALCANCGAPLLGPHCYSCGQPVKGMVRHLGSIVHDIFDTILNIDSRLFRTLVPLYFKPGFLSCEYFAGRRVRYVTPFRLYFFLSVVAFLAMQWAIEGMDLVHDLIRIDSGDRIGAALTVEEVAARRDEALAELDKKKNAAMPDVALKGIEKAEDSVRNKAEKRLQYLKRVEEAKARNQTPPRDSADSLSLNGERWDAQNNPIRIGWLPAFANAKLNQLAAHAVDNLHRIRQDPKPFLLGSFGALPQVLFVLMPLFAVLLKIFYLFKRRLYMEHLIVALHSHSFIFVSLLLLTVLGLTRSWAHASAAWLETPLDWLMFAAAWWLPIYLLIMQKKVYQQGWLLTVLKYCVIGICYTVLIGFGAGAAFLVSLATT